MLGFAEYIDFQPLLKLYLDIALANRYTRKRPCLTMKNLSIAYASNDKGVLMLGVSMYSLFISKNKDTIYKIYILEDAISDTNKRKLEKLSSAYGCELVFVDLSELLKTHIRKNFEQWPAVTYGRLFLPSLLPDEGLVLYIDIDTLVMRDLTEALELPMGEYAMGVVHQKQDAVAAGWKERLRIPSSYPYFNAGVLLMNLAYMRKNNIEAEMLAFLSRHEGSLQYPDQDVLNGVMYDKVLALSPVWNWHASHTRKLLYQYKRGNSRWGHCSAAEMKEAACHPCIIHFPGLPKPTSYNYNFYGKLYRKIWLQSPWKDESAMQGRRVKCLLRRLLYFPTDTLIRLKMKLHVLKQRPARQRCGS